MTTTGHEIDSSFDDRKDPLGARMKERYEAQTRVYLPRHQPTLIRVDGRSFSSYTRGLDRPYDQALMEAMGQTTEYLCSEVSGCALGYCQSDEISLALVDYLSETSEAFFGGNVQKIVSTVASAAAAYFNSIYRHPQKPQTLATFDARAFSVPNAIEAANAILWRQQDAYRNAVSMVGQAHFSARELHKVSTSALTDKLRAERGVDVDSFDPAFLKGQVVERVEVLRPVEYFDKRTQTTVTTEPVLRRVWERRAAPEFKGLDWLLERIPAPPIEIALAPAGDHDLGL